MSSFDIRDSSSVNKGAELIRERASGEVTVYLFVSSLSFVAVNSDQAFRMIQRVRFTRCGEF